MNNEQAKFILRAYRPNGRDAGNAVFCEALRQAQTDPVLGAWLAREQAFDAAVAAKLGACAAPPELREAILAGAQLSTLLASRASRPWQRPAAWMALAASLAVIFTLAATYWFRSPGPAPAAFDQMARFALTEPLSAHTGPHADKLGAVGAWLENPANRIAEAPPVDLAQLKAQGCRTVSIAGHEVFEICFKRGDGWYHLYLARRSDFAVGDNAKAPVVLAQDQRSAAAWTDQRLVYVLMAGGGAEVLRRIL
jgi:hypothetical protein